MTHSSPLREKVKRNRTRGVGVREREPQCELLHTAPLSYPPNSQNRRQKPGARVQSQMQGLVGAGSGGSVTPTPEPNQAHAPFFSPATLYNSGRQGRSEAPFRDSINLRYEGLAPPR